MFELNYFKVQMDIIKDYERSLLSKKAFNWKFTEYQDNIWCFNNVCGYAIPKNLFILNTVITENRFISNLLLIGGNYDSIWLTRDYTDVDKIHCRVFTNDDYTVLVDSKLLKHFILEECVYEYSKGLVRILSNEMLIGVICSIRKGGN